MIDTEGLREQETGIRKKSPLLVIMICAFLSVVFTKVGFLSLFFLAPVGFAVLICNSIWLPFISSAAVNIGFLIVMRIFFRDSSGGFFLAVLYFSALFLGFCWIMGESRIRTAYRFVLASAAGTLVFLIYINSPNSAFYAVLKDMAETSAQVFNSTGIDPERPSLLRITPERIIEMVEIFLLRGGAFAGTLFMFFINRKVSLGVASMIAGQKKDRGLRAFFAPPFAIWVLSGTIAVILLTRIFRIQIIEIAAWNVFVICAILFFAQGIGIIMHFLARRAYVFRLIFVVLAVIAVFSPGLNVFAFSAIVLLGIIENWLPLRTPKEGQASTPEP
jgi:hypothetical protein